MDQKRKLIASCIALCPLVGLALAGLPAVARAQAPTECAPDDDVCIEGRLGPVRGSLRVRIGGDEPEPVAPAVPAQPPAPAPAPPPIVVQPAPPLQPAAPPQPATPAQPATPVQPAVPVQPPTVIVQPAPQPVPVQAPVPAPPLVARAEVPYENFTTGVHLHVDGAFGDRTGLGGAGAGFRLRPIPFLGIELGTGVYGGEDFNGDSRAEVPLTLNAMFFFNPYHRFQFYGVLGAGFSWAHTEGVRGARDNTYAGGEAGVGVEWRLSRFFALNLDARFFLRERIDDNPNPEFVDPATGASTDTSAGVRTQLGMTFYFGS